MERVAGERPVEADEEDDQEAEDQLQEARVAAEGALKTNDSIAQMQAWYRIQGRINAIFIL